MPRPANGASPQGRRRCVAAGSATWWENRGCAPIYRQYDFALRFKSGDKEFVLKTDADTREWLPGDSLYDDAVYLPHEMPKRQYELSVGLLDRWTGKPRIRLAQEGAGETLWHSLGGIEVI